MSMMGGPMMGSMMGGPMGNPMMGSMTGNPMMGGPMMGGPMMGGPGMGGPGMGGPMMEGRGVIPGQQAPPQYGGTFMMPVDPPRRRILEEKPVIPFGTNFVPPPPLIPGEPSGFHPLLEHNLGINRLPNAYRNYQYGPRQMWWANPVTVPEANTGIMINCEMPMQSWMEGRFLDPNKAGEKSIRGDHFIRNEGWMMLNPNNLKPYDADEVARMDPSHTFGDYSLAMDMADVKRKQGVTAEAYIEEKYKKMRDAREDQGYFTIDKVGMRNMELEILDEQELREFWADPNAIIQDTLE